MTDTEQKALALWNEVCFERKMRRYVSLGRTGDTKAEALCRAIERHEAFRQKVSYAAQEATEIIDHWSGDCAGAKCLQDFIIPAPKTDPLVDVFCKGLWSEAGLSISTKEIRAALDALGFEIREKNDDN